MKEKLGELLGRTFCGFLVALPIYGFAHLTPEGYDMRDFLAIIGFMGGFIFLYNDNLI